MHMTRRTTRTHLIKRPRPPRALVPVVLTAGPKTATAKTTTTKKTTKTV